MTPENLHTVLNRAVAAVVARRAGSLGDHESAGTATFARATLRRIENSEHGDWSSTIALVEARSLGIEARELAADIAGELLNEPTIESAEAAGPGFINIRLSRRHLAQIAIDIIRAEAGDPRSGGVHLGGVDLPGMEDRLAKAQMAYAAIRRLERNALAAGIGSSTDVPIREIDPQLLGADLEVALLLALSEHRRFEGAPTPDWTVRNLANYLESVADLFEEWTRRYTIIPLIGEEITETHDARLLLLRATGIVLKSGLESLGLPAPEKM